MELLAEKNCFEFKKILLPDDQNENIQNESFNLEKIAFDELSGSVILSSKNKIVYSGYVDENKYSEAHFLSYYSTLKYEPHKSKIKCISSCFKKPLFATLSSENELSIWNYKTKLLELKKRFEHENITWIDLSPNGLYIAVGLMSRVKVYSISSENLREFKDIQIRNANIVINLINISQYYMSNGLNVGRAL